VGLRPTKASRPKGFGESFRTRVAGRGARPSSDKKGRKGIKKGERKGGKKGKGKRKGQKR